MLVEYRNEIIRRRERLGLSFCNKCPLKDFDSDPCYVENMPYTCPVTGYITASTSEIFKLWK